VNPRPKPLHPTSIRRRLLPDVSTALRAATTIAVAGAIAVACAAGAFAQDASKIRVTVIGDSVTASFDYVPAARRYLGKGLDLRSDAVVCLRLVATSCPFQGSTPSTALQVVGSKRSALGPVVVVNVGYNDWPAVYDVDRVMRALKVAGVRSVIWVTLREATSYAGVYAESNARIRKAAGRWKGRLVVADWNTYSRGKAWFRDDGLHLTTSGALGLARLLRPLVLAGATSS
jgi:hypothetical protein